MAATAGRLKQPVLASLVKLCFIGAMTIVADALAAAGLSQTELAAHLEVTPQAVNQWVRSGRVPAERCVAVEIATGVSRYELRPDIFGQPPHASLDEVA